MEYTENDYLRQKLLESTDISEIPEGAPSKWQQKKKKKFPNQSNSFKNFQWKFALKMLSKDKIFTRWQFPDQTPECKRLLEQNGSYEGKHYTIIWTKIYPKMKLIKVLTKNKDLKIH